MAEAKLCVDCGEFPKRAGHPKWCEECWLERRDIDQRISASRARLAMVPKDQRASRIVESRWPPGRRWCAGCQTFIRLRVVAGSASRCRDCAAASAHATRLKTTYRVHDRPFVDKDYDELMRAQGGRCYLCRRLPLDHRLVVDHDHATGQVRGLLCGGNEWSCNYKILSQFDKDDDPVEMARRLLRYLQGDTPAQKLPQSWG